MLAEIIAVCAIVLIIGAATAYIVKAKKSGKKCIGCPDGCCGCNHKSTAKKKSDGTEGTPCCCCSKQKENE